MTKKQKAYRLRMNDKLHEEFQRRRKIIYDARCAGTRKYWDTLRENTARGKAMEQSK